MPLDMSDGLRRGELARLKWEDFDFRGLSTSGWPISYATRILNRETRAEEFAVLGRPVAGVAIRSLKVPHDVNGFERLHSLICADIQGSRSFKN